MEEIVFDIEVFPQWWCIVYSNPENTQVGVIQSTDSDYMKRINDIRYGKCLIGFNIKRYDLRILHLIISGGDPTDVHALSKAIIDNNETYPFNNYFYWRKFNFSDLYDDWRYGSLKAFESNIGMSIKESSISFDKRDLTDTEKEEIISYCKHDVKATCKLLEVRREYVDAKKMLANTFSLNLAQSLKSTVAKLGASVLGAKKKTWSDDGIFVIPKRVEFYIKDNVPENIVSMFKYLDDETKTARLFDNDVIYGAGGIHSTIMENIFTKNDDEYVLVNYDARSYYPMLMIVFNLLSRNISNKERYIEVYEMSSELKAKLDEIFNNDEYSATKKLREGLKLILNASYGASKNQYNDLYDPYNATSMCYLGQLLLTALANKLYKNGAKIIQTNTDGILLKVKRDKLDSMRLIVKEWETIVGIAIEEHQISMMFQRDVNNYIEVDLKGKYKLKGRWTNQAVDGYANLNAPVAHKALLEYYINNTPIEETILKCDNPLDFCFTAVTGYTYDKTYYYINDEPHLANKVNRVMATTDQKYGTIKKYKIKDDRYDKIAEIPLNCLLMNDELYIPETLDREWYVNFAKNKVKELSNV